MSVNHIFLIDFLQQSPISNAAQNYPLTHIVFVDIKKMCVKTGFALSLKD